MDPPPRFAADAMLGSLARWLRLLGYDCTYEADIADAKLIDDAGAQGRAVLTRDRLVARRASPAVFIESDDLDEQLLAVVAAFHLALPDELPTTRCSVCNALLEEASGEARSDGSIPPRVRASHTEFWRCPQCRRFYWKGTHFTSMGERLAALRKRAGQAPQA